MNEARQFEESDLPPLSNIEESNEEGEAVIADRLTPLLDKVINSVEIPTLQEELHLPKPEEVLHRVVEAAEHNQAIEKMLEMKHEIKDTGNIPHTTSNPASLSQLLKTKTEEFETVYAQRREAVPKVPGMLYRLLHDNSLYGHAIRYGFLVAAFSLIVAIVVVLLFT